MCNKYVIGWVTADVGFYKLVTDTISLVDKTHISCHPSYNLLVTNHDISRLVCVNYYTCYQYGLRCLVLVFTVHAAHRVV